MYTVQCVCVCVCVCVHVCTPQHYTVLQHSLNLPRLITHFCCQSFGLCNMDYFYICIFLSCRDRADVYTCTLYSLCASYSACIYSTTTVYNYIHDIVHSLCMD